ncbi:MAG: TIGR03013 family PEP-CTERM/XrtA system glycosyltransferase [Gammaproteobacteria bacterium]|nr:TIGR03013 family PEP-CTERM/XrtA system glycosyltransferase [Gammaproteobacteria bacterium]
MIVSVYVGNFLRFYPEQELIEGGLWGKALITALVTVIAMLATGLYQGQLREGMAGVLLRIIIGFISSGVLVSLIFYLFPGLLLERGVMIISYVQAFFVIGTIRVFFFEIVDTSAFKKRVLVYGAGYTASHIDLGLRRKSDRRGFDIVGYRSLEGQKIQVKASQVIAISETLLDYAQKNNIDEIVVAVSDVKHDIPVDELVDCKLNGITVSDILSFFEREAGQVRIDIIDPAWLVTSEGFRQSSFQDGVKRVFDILASLIILIVASPFLLLTAIAILIEDGLKAPVFYSQTRVGKQGVHYDVYKFRSMHTDAEQDGAAIWARQGDSRVTRVGAFIRRTRLDEFPQILNVLMGTMSFVGPRPERPEFVENLTKEIPYYCERHLVKPGVTGWAQMLYPYGSSIKDSYQKQLFDMYYVKNQSLFLDCLILLQTVEVVLFGKGAR